MAVHVEWRQRQWIVVPVWLVSLLVKTTKILSTGVVSILTQVDYGNILKPNTWVENALKCNLYRKSNE